MREQLVEILRLTNDDSFPHVARMVGIRNAAQAALDELATPAAKTGAVSDGAKAGNQVPPKAATPVGAPAK